MQPHACLIDALGTTVRLLPPWDRLDPELVSGIPPERVREAFAAEMTHYAAHAHEARDASSLADLRRECAAILSRGLGRDISVDAMMAAIIFEAYGDAAPALAAMREAGLTLVCVSNWDFELGRVLERVGLAGLFDGLVVSAAVGARKPDPAIFTRALDVAGCEAADAVHVGDTEDDAAGAEAAGIRFLRIDRDGDGGDLASLAELPAMLTGGAMGQHSPP